MAFILGTFDFPAVGGELLQLGCQNFGVDAERNHSGQIHVAAEACGALVKECGHADV